MRKSQSRNFAFTDSNNKKALECEKAGGWTKQSAKDMFRGLRKVELAFKGTGLHFVFI